MVNLDYFNVQFKPFSWQIRAIFWESSGYFCVLALANSGENTRESGENTRESGENWRGMDFEQFWEPKKMLLFGPNMTQNLITK